MDLIHRTRKYQDTLDRVRKMRAAPPSADQAELKLQQYQEELDSIIGQMRSDQDYDTVRVHYALLFIAVAAVGILYAIVNKVFLLPLYVLLALVAYIWLTHRLMRVTISQFSKRPNDATDISEQIQFALNGVTIKKRRLLLLSFFYIIFFPVLMLLLQNIGLGALQGISWFLNLLIAIVVSSGMWYWYFNLSFDEYDDIEESLEIIQEQIG